MKKRTVSIKTKSKNTVKDPRKQDDSKSHKYTKFNSNVLEEHSHLKKYIKIHKDEYKFTCIGCKMKNFPESEGYYHHLIAHLETVKHRIAVEEDDKEVNEAISAIQEFRKRKKKVVKVNKVTLDEFRVDVTLFLLKHELPFSLSSSLVDFMKNQTIKYGEEATKQVTLSDKTAATIARETLCKSAKEDLFKDLQNNYFSLSFDGGSDGYGPSYLCSHVRFIKEGQYHHQMLSLNEIGKSYTGESLFSIVNSIFEGPKMELLKKNLVGVCTDEGSNMNGSDKGLAGRLKEQFPHIIVANDLSHCFNLITKHALGKFCKRPITLVTDICAYFSKSSLRKAKFKEIQEIFNEEMSADVLKILRHVDTRWTSLLKSIKRILILWESLENYFCEYREESPPELTQQNRLYLEVLECLLQRLSINIEYFENDNREYSTILSKLNESLILTSQLILKEEQLGNISREVQIERIIKLPFQDKNKINSYLKDFETFKADFKAKYPGINSYSKELSSKEIDDCYTSAQDFLVEAVYRMAIKLPLQREVLQHCHIVRLEEDEFSRKSLEKWMSLSKQFTNIITQENFASFSNELESFGFNYKDHQSLYKDFKVKFSNNSKLPSQSVLQFWQNLKDVYPFMSSVAFACLTLPYSTISIERTFSVLRDIKYSKRNRLCTTGVEACLMIHQLSHQSSNFEINENVMAQYKNMWHSREKDQCDGPPEELKQDNAVKIMLSDSNFTYTQESQEKKESTLDDQGQLHQSQSSERNNKQKASQVLSREEFKTPLKLFKSSEKEK